MTVTIRSQKGSLLQFWGMWGLGFAIAFSAFGFSVWQQRDSAEVRASRLLDKAIEFNHSGDRVKAEKLAAEALKLDPTSGRSAMVAVESAVARQDFQQAVDYLHQVKSTDIRIRIRCGVTAAEIMHQRLYRLADAEREYKTVLDLAPDDIRANMGMAKLCAVCGRKREAIPYVLRLVRLDAESDLLVLLSSNDVVINDIPFLEKCRLAAPLDPNPLVGLAWHAAQNERRDEALIFLSDALKIDPNNLAAKIAIGHLLLDSNRFDELRQWTNTLPTWSEAMPETWIIRAKISEEIGDKPGAIRCYWESVRLAPEVNGSIFHLARLLAGEKESLLSTQFSKYLVRLQELETAQNRVLFARDRSRAGPFFELAQKYEAVGRFWEAFGWCRFGVRVDNKHLESLELLEKLGRHLVNQPLKLVADEYNIALQTDLSIYPLPNFVGQIESSVEHVRNIPHNQTSFREDSAESNLVFQYFNGTEGPPTKRMFELTGGGIGVLDYDLDGCPDIYFTQGRPWPSTIFPSNPTHHHPNTYVDKIFRNREGVCFEDVSTSAKIQEQGFGQGVTVGDFNADGFPDIYIGNIGANQLCVNQGDGTFKDVTQEAGVSGSEWTTSCVMADLNGDGLPDIYAVSYVTADDVLERVCQHDDGTPKQCSPSDFKGERDRFWLNDGDGHFTDATSTALSREPMGMGLGVAVWDAHENGRLSLMVANDTTYNFFYVNETQNSGPFQLRECGVEAGVALNGDGKATGSMGIALGDVNDDGLLDALITNFYGEPNSLFVSESVGVFVDKSRAYGLYEPSLNELGFGAQFIDADLDGVLELFVANGHVDDLRKIGRPYRMHAQLFRLKGRRFEVVDGKWVGPYFENKWLGRAVAKVDWNGDGREDLIVGHLVDNSALLTNTTEYAGKSVSIRLSGIISNRDAIGTRIFARVGTRTFVRQLTAGDGYQASNDRHILLGAGTEELIDEIRVYWPSGLIQLFENIPTSRKYCLREGASFVEIPSCSTFTLSPGLVILPKSGD